MTPLIKRILFATDFSPCAVRAQDYALFLASSWGAELNVLHVLEFPPGMNPDYPVNSLYLNQLRKEATRSIEELMARATQSGIATNKHLLLGIPSQRICAIADECRDDLIVLGTRGRTGLEHILLGSTAERVIKTAPCPVLAVRLPKTEGSGGAPGIGTPVRLARMLVPIDGSDCSLDALEYAAQLAMLAGTTVTLLHVVEPVAYGIDFTLGGMAEREQQRAQMHGKLESLTAALRSVGLTVDHVVRGGLPGDSIVEVARVQASDLIVMGTHGRRGISHVMSGSVAEAVLRKGGCPVLTVRSPKFGPGHRRIVATPDGHTAGAGV